MCNERARIVVGADGLSFAGHLKTNLVYVNTVVPTVDKALALCSAGIYGRAYVQSGIAPEFRRRLTEGKVRHPDFIIEY